MKPTPILDGRGMDDVLGELLADVPGYLVHWRPQPGHSGYGLLQILSRYCGLVIQTLDGAMDKGGLAFLDALGIDLLPPQAAMTPLVFQLAPNSPVDALLPAGTEVAAPPPTVLPSSIAPATSSAPALPPDPIVFATDESITLARASLASAYSTYPDQDTYADHSASLSSGFKLYRDMQPVAHHLYVGHDSQLTLDGAVDVSLRFQLDSTLPRSARLDLPGLDLTWEYATAGGWIEFGSKTDTTNGLRDDGEVLLHKRGGPPAQSAPVHGIPSFWIRARLGSPLPPTSKDQPLLPMIDTVRVSVATDHIGLPCDVAFVNGIRTDTSKDFKPFGDQPGLGANFVFACDHAFQQPGATAGISPVFSSGVDIGAATDLKLEWEYSVGPGQWRPLGVVDYTKGLSTATLLEPAIGFVCPDDWAKASYNGEEHYWLRIRVAAGGHNGWGYGGPPTYSIGQDKDGSWSVQIGNPPKPPSLSSISFSSSSQTGPFIPDHCLALNGFAYQDCSDACRWGRRPFPPFSALPDRYAAVYFGFSQPLPSALVGLYVAIPGRVAAQAPPTPYLWEYETAQGWSPLAVLDQTGGFATSGMIQLIGPPDAVPAAGPEGDSYRIRARLRETADPSPSAIDAVYLNAVSATQRRSVRGEVLGRSDGTPRQAMVAQHPPVLGRQLLEVQEWNGTGHDWESLFAGIPTWQLRYETDPRDNVTAVWVTWEERPHLYLSGPGDRHYVIERSGGLIRFGDGVQALVPPPGRPVRLSYDYGGGVQGNMAAGSITQLHSGVPYLQAVTNPLAADGGAEGELLAQVRGRGSQRLRNGGRAVAAADYEWLAREASPEVALARCLPTTGPDGLGQPGWVTVVVVPQGVSREPLPSQQLLGLVEQRLAAAAPAAVAGQVRVIGPRYQPISVIAEIIPTDVSQAGAVEDDVRRTLDRFLHPVSGGVDGRGWEFGADVHLSQVVQVVLAASGVAAAPHISLVSGTRVFGDSVPLFPDALPSSGKHQLKFSVGVT
jgi:hypothetical protein